MGWGSVSDGVRWGGVGWGHVSVHGHYTHQPDCTCDAGVKFRVGVGVGFRAGWEGRC